MGKNYKLYNVGDKVEIIHSHSDDKGKIGIITEVRHSFCKIDIGIHPQNGKRNIVNHCWNQVRKIVDNENN